MKTKTMGGSRIRSIWFLVPAVMSLSLEAIAAERKPGKITQAKQQCTPIAPGKLVNMQFDGTNLKSLAENVGRAICRNFTFHGINVAKTRLDVVSPVEVRSEEIWRVFLTILAAHNFTIVDDGPIATIIPATDGTRSAIPFYGWKEEVPDDEERMVTKVIKLRPGLDVNSTSNFLNIFKTGKGQIHPFAKKRVLVITDFGPSVKRLISLLDQLSKKK